jgi:hypothetical protein
VTLLKFNVNSTRKTEKTSQRKFKTRRYLKMVSSLETNESASELFDFGALELQLTLDM